MWDKLKQIPSKIGTILAIAGVGLLGILALVFIRKNQQVEAFKAQLDLAETQKHVDILDAQIAEHKATKATTAKEIEALNDLQSQLEAKRQTLATQEQGKSSDEIEDYWKKN